jgi:hypothetical protein
MEGRWIREEKGRNEKGREGIERKQRAGKWNKWKSKGQSAEQGWRKVRKYPPLTRRINEKYTQNFLSVIQ